MGKPSDTAISYALMGWRIFPCIPNSKAPATGNGFYAATSDMARIEAWVAENPDYNWATVPEYNGQGVVDVDSYKEGAADIDLPETFVVSTPHGGEHHYFIGSLPPTAKGQLGHGIDTRGRGSYVLLPGSIVDDKPYEVKHDRPISRAPTWITDRLARSDNQAQRVEGESGPLDSPESIRRARVFLSDLVGRGDVAVSGRGGNDRTYRVAAELRRLGVSEHRALELIDELWNPHCEPPWSSDELEALVEHGYKYGLGQAGDEVVPPTEQLVPATIAQQLAAEPRKRSRFHPEDEDEQEQGEDPSWLIKELMPERSTALMLGATQSYKSFLALDMCLSISTATETFSTVPPRGITFYAALEGRFNLKKARRRAWKLGHGINRKIEGFYVMPAPLVAIPDDVQEFGDQIKWRSAGRTPSLVVVDTLSKSMGGLNENDAGDANRFVQFCDSLVDQLGCSVLALHHTGKDEGRGARGSSAIWAGFDTVLEVIAHRDTKAVEVWVRKQKDAEEREEPFTFQGRAVGPSLIFQSTTAEEHRLLTGKGDQLEGRAVGLALQALGAYGPDRGATLRVLATQMTPRAEGDTDALNRLKLQATERSLRALSKTKLKAYQQQVGDHQLWFLPAPST